MIIPAKPMKLRYTLRAILVAMTLLALWCAYSINWIRQRRAAIEDHLVFPIMFDGSEEQEAPGLLWMFGEKGYHQLVVNGLDDGPEVNRMRAIFPEAICSGRAMESSQPGTGDQIPDTLIINGDVIESL